MSKAEKVRKVLGTICIMPMILFYGWCVGKLISPSVEIITTQADRALLIAIGIVVSFVVGVILLSWGE